MPLSVGMHFLVIADRAGKEQLTQVMARREARGEGVQSAQHRSRGAATPDSPVAPSITRLPWLAWAGFVLVLLLALALFAIFEVNWTASRMHW